MCLLKNINCPGLCTQRGGLLVQSNKSKVYKLGTWKTLTPLRDRGPALDATAIADRHVATPVDQHGRRPAGGRRGSHRIFPRDRRRGRAARALLHARRAGQGDDNARRQGGGGETEGRDDAAG